MVSEFDAYQDLGTFCKNARAGATSLDTKSGAQLMDDSDAVLEYCLYEVNKIKIK